MTARCPDTESESRSARCLDRVLFVSVAAIMVMVTGWVAYFDYLTGDEYFQVRATGRGNYEGAFLVWLDLSARPFFGVFLEALVVFVGVDELRLRMVRGAVAVALGVTLGVFAVWLRRANASPNVAWVTALSVAAQRGAYGIAGFAFHMGAALPAIWFGGLSLFLYLRALAERGVRRALGVVLCVASFTVAFWTSQSLCGLVFAAVAYGVLSKRINVRTAAGFVGAAYVVAAGSTLLVRCCLTLRYEKAGRALGALDNWPDLIRVVVSPFRYFTAFQFVHPTFLPDHSVVMGRVFECASAAVLASAFVADLVRERERPMTVLGRWCVALACLGYGIALQIADASRRFAYSRNPHVQLALSAIVLSMLAYALPRIGEHVRPMLRKLVFAAVMMIVAANLGAAVADLYHGVVIPRTRELAYALDCLRRREGDEPVRHVTIIPRQVNWICEYPPCDYWFGYANQTNVAFGKSIVRYLLPKLGEESRHVRIVVTEEVPAESSPSHRIIDGRTYAALLSPVCEERR